MSSTAKIKLAELKARLEADKATINHDGEWREYVEEVRTMLRLSLSNGSKYSKHASAIDGR